VILLTDDQRFDTIRALGNNVVRTPNMDRLVSRGVAFTHACTQGGLSGAICMPSRAQFMTGLSMFRAHQRIVDHQETPDPAVRTFPERLRAEGHLTFATGKWHNGPVLFHRSFSHGANIFFGGMFDHLKTPVHDFDPTGKYPKDRARVTGKFSSEMFSDAAIHFLEQRDRSKPYVAYVAFTSPHDPRMAPARFRDLYPPERMDVPKNFLPEHPFDIGSLKIRDELLAPFPRTREEVRKHMAAYYAMISEVDYHIGRVLDAVEKSEDAHNTYIIFAGDNGLAVGQHGLFGKQSLYDHSLRVPLVISGPGIPVNRRAQTLCHIMDLCPTILDLAGVPVPDVEGQSLRPALSTQSIAVRRSVISAYINFQRAIRTDTHKLILYNVAGKRRMQLFDLENDPSEMHNLAADRVQKSRIAELKSAMKQQLKQAGDPVDLDAEVWKL
jgi:arylsulfatase A-like enzyme